MKTYIILYILSYIMSYYFFKWEHKHLDAGAYNWKTVGSSLIVSSLGPIPILLAIFRYGWKFIIWPLLKKLINLKMWKGFKDPPWWL